MEKYYYKGYIISLKNEREFYIKNSSNTYLFNFLSDYDYVSYCVYLNLSVQIPFDSELGTLYRLYPEYGFVTCTNLRELIIPSNITFSLDKQPFKEKLTKSLKGKAEELIELVELFKNPERFYA
jgi:hypothetical protein